MPILTVFNLPAMQTQSDGHVVRALERAGHGAPLGRLCHTASVLDDGSLIVVDAWESAEMLDEFGEALLPVFHTAVLTPVEPKLYVIHNIIEG